jgi:23S rRNA pseudouridine2605 synthase
MKIIKLKTGKSEESLRLNRYVANSGVCSRRDADKLIANGEIAVNGQVITELGTKVRPTDRITRNGIPLSMEKKRYLLLNKPRGFVTTTDDPHATHTVMELVASACTERIYPVGRLDRDTTGLLLFTNDGDLAKKLMHPAHRQRKVYHVHLNRPLAPDDLQRIRNGITLDDGLIAADKINFPDECDPTQVGIEIHSGRNRIIRRIFEHLGYRVTRLDRVCLGGLTKKNLPRGHWRFLSQNEVNFLKM